MEGGKWVPKIKLTNNVSKTTNPGFKKIYRAFDRESGFALADVITGRDEVIEGDRLIVVDPANYLRRSSISNFDLEELQKPIFIQGELVYDDPEILEKQAYCNRQMARLYPAVKRIENPREYYVDCTEEYVNFKNQLILDTQKSILEL